MKEIVVISGKGGTGKTSITASFAALSKNSVFADCDVDAADLYLILKPNILRSEPFIGGKIPEIIPDECIDCGLCQDVCRYDAIGSTAGEDHMLYSVNPINCEGCGVCVALCPNEAISFEPRKSGDLYFSETEFGPMIHARLGIAQENSGKLVSLVRAHAKKTARELQSDLIIVDGTPGTGCPVISSVTGADVVVIVTEPTVSGMHDLKRVLDLTDNFKLPSYIIINKFDINMGATKSIEELSESREIEILGRIPFDPIVTKAQINGLPVVAYKGNQVSTEIRSTWKKLTEKMSIHDG